MKEYNYCPLCATHIKERIIAGRKRKFYPSCNFVVYKNPLPLATVVAVQNNKFLLTKRATGSPKGDMGCSRIFIDIRGNTRRSLLRRIKRVNRHVGRNNKTDRSTRLQDMEICGNMLLIKYLVHLEEGNPIPGDEVEKIKFFTFTE